jgi:hypothetical protein
MRADPRCPYCDGKVSATAEWCMHCGREFDGPVDAAGSGERAESDESELFGSNAESDRRTDDRPPVPSGRGTDGPSLLPVGGFDHRQSAGRFLGVLGLAGVASVVGLGLSLPTTGAGMAALAWLGSVALLARRRSAFDAMRYGSYSAMLLVIFVSLSLAFAAEGQSRTAFLLALVPVAVATLLVAGFGDTVAETV